MSLERAWPLLWRYLPERLARLTGGVLPERKIRARNRLLGLLPKGGRGVEVGVWRGDFSEVLLHALDPMELHLVDPWKYLPEYGEALYGGAGARSQAEMDRLYRAVLDRFASDCRVRVHRRASSRAAREFGDESLAWVYLDANHTYEEVHSDLDTWGPKVQPGGFLCGDDFGVPGWWEEGVTRAVRATIRETTLQPVLLYGGQYALRKPVAAEPETGRA